MPECAPSGLRAKVGPRVRRQAQPDGDQGGEDGERSPFNFNRWGWGRAAARSWACPRSRWLDSVLTFLTVFGPGLVVMEADNDAGAVSTYVQAGAHGTRLLWILLLLLPVTYFIQEMVVRLGIATGKGHAAMIYQRFGRWWGLFSLVDLQLVNFLTLVTEFAAISLALSHLNIAPRVGVPLAALVLIVKVLSGSYRRWERVTVFLCLLT